MDSKISRFMFLVLFLIAAVALVPAFLSLASGAVLIPVLIMIVGFLILAPIIILKRKH